MLYFNNMPLELAELLAINVTINDRDPVLQRVTTEAMIKYVEARDFSHTITHDSGLAAYAHASLMVTGDGDPYLFDIGIDTCDNSDDARTRSVNTRQFLFDMQRYHKLSDQPVPTQLQILNDLL